MTMEQEDLRSDDEWVNEALGFADMSPPEEGWGAKDALEEIQQTLLDEKDAPEPRDTLLLILALAYAGVRAGNPEGK